MCLNHGTKPNMWVLNHGYGTKPLVLNHGYWDVSKSNGGRDGKGLSFTKPQC